MFLIDHVGNSQKHVLAFSLMESIHDSFQVYVFNLYLVMLKPKERFLMFSCSSSCRMIILSIDWYHHYNYLIIIGITIIISILLWSSAWWWSNFGTNSWTLKQLKSWLSKSINQSYWETKQRLIIEASPNIWSKTGLSAKLTDHQIKARLEACTVAASSKVTWKICSFLLLTFATC